jgi:hypothetical protein
MPTLLITILITENPISLFYVEEGNVLEGIEAFDNVTVAGAIHATNYGYLRCVIWPPINGADWHCAPIISCLELETMLRRPRVTENLKINGFRRANFQSISIAIVTKCSMY